MNADDWVKIIPPAAVGIFLILLGIANIIEIIKGEERDDDE